MSSNKSSPLKLCFKSKISLADFKAWCIFYEIFEEDEIKKEIMDLRKRGYKVSLLMAIYKVSPF